MNIENKGEELKISYDDFKSQVISDYKIAVTSRECSVLGRREVFSEKGKFGIFGDGKELPQLALNHFFKKVIIEQDIIETRPSLWRRDSLVFRIFSHPYMLT